ncbi:alpha/beta hydrolase [Novipirellula caenicola]|uniref:Alpha/beta hydrolase fold-3 domain-containing protein n=1 Tax=Novipirellula caenicola TaxID=1536901 RepID=A0ABP9VJH5_9BACT
MKAFSCICTLVFLCFSLPSAQALETKGFSPDKRLVYKSVGDTKLKLHVFEPADHKATDSRPVAVFFFGGGWVGGSPSQFYPHCEYLASRGIVAIAAEYRVKSKHNTTPKECVKDGKSAIRWVRSHASELGIDPNKVIAGGGSAGGHVAAATATTEAFNEAGEDTSVSCVPNALVLFNPVFDNGPVGGWSHSKVKEYWQDISPAHNISATTPPTIVLLGTKDKLIPVETAERYKKNMEANGRRCDLHLYEDQEHGFFNFNKPENYQATVKAMDRFLASLGYLQGEPTLK